MEAAPTNSAWPLGPSCLKRNSTNKIEPNLGPLAYPIFRRGGLTCLQPLDRCHSTREVHLSLSQQQREYKYFTDSSTSITHDRIRWKTAAFHPLIGHSDEGWNPQVSKTGQTLGIQLQFSTGCLSQQVSHLQIFIDP